MWEDYLNLAVRDVADKYQARRLKARVRAQLLDLYEIYRSQGMESDQALGEAMALLGDPLKLGAALARPIKHQRGWLWLFSVAQLVLGVGIMLASYRTESFAALALGRIMALWGMLATGFQTRKSGQILSHLQLLRWHVRRAGRSVPMADFSRMVAVGFGSGILVALVAGVPWNLVTANTLHPVVVSTGSAILISGVAAAIPWALFRRRLGPAFYWVTLQAWGALGAALGATLLVLWNQGFAPPPLYNWQPELLLVGGWIFNFAVLRLVAALALLKDRVLIGLDDERTVV
ncbi:hypothetical protein HIJ39_06935 [Sulfobacillus sp. DSM 109850]|uniref:Uncharacterized protein n=1 Tax=Sulfobacillus harzensis TaxID=2729629 RepID=A0A7Y0Q1G9_9FIRM|nr:hypothetical protein [Sulfobacillus harzensis]